MKLIEIDRDNLPKCDVLAYNGIDAPKIGQLEVIDESSVFCIYGQSDEDYIANVTLYLPLDDIKPESEKPNLLDVLPNEWIVYKSNNKIDVYRSFRDAEDGLVYDEQQATESIRDFEQRMIESLQ